MVEYLRPASKKHSITKVRASIILPQPIIRPDELFQHLKMQPEFQRYQKKTVKKTRTIEINHLFNVDFSKAAEQEKIEGFTFEEFSDEGSLINYLTLQNEENHCTLSFETRMYTRWDDFFNRFKEDLIFMSNYLRLYVHIISLTYVDEFIWVHPSKIPVGKIFDSKSDLISGKFLGSENGSLILVSQVSEEKTEEKTEIAFNNRLKRVTISHQYVERLDSKNIHSVQELIDSNSFDYKFNSAHDSNKSMLNNLLSSEVKERISLI